MSTFVSVGNSTQAFRRLLDAVQQVASRLPQPVFVQYGACDGVDCPTCDSAPYISMLEFERRVNDASLLILHAGAGSVIHAVRSGKVPVVMPRSSALGEIVDEHQQEFALALGLMGKLVVCTDPAQLLSAAAAAVELQSTQAAAVSEPALLRGMRQLLHEHSQTVLSEGAHE